MTTELTGPERSALDLIQKDKAYENYFLRKTEKPRFFHPLKELGFFNPSHNPGPKESEEKGYFSMPEWNVLPYLERLSAQIRPGTNEWLIDELLAIIKNTSTATDRKDNYRTWWYFVKILVNLPNDRISDDILALIPGWLDTRFDNTLPAADIAKSLLPKFLTGDAADLKKAASILDAMLAVKWSPVPESLQGLGDKEEVRFIANSHWLGEVLLKAANTERLGKGLPADSIFAVADRLLQIIVRRRRGAEIEDDGISISAKVLDDGRVEVSLARPASPPHLVTLKASNPEEFAAKVKEELAKADITLGAGILAKVPVLFDSLFDDYSYIWIKAVSPGKLEDYGRVEVALSGVLTTLAHAKANQDKAMGKTIVEQFLSDKYRPSIFRRIALSLIKEFWSEYEEVFWGAYKRLDFFSNHSFEAEVYRLLESVGPRFTEEQKGVVRGIVAAGPSNASDLTPNQLVYWKQKWLSALKGIAEFAALYEDARKTTGVVEEVSFKTPMVRSGPGPSPLSRDEIIRLSSAQIVELLLTFRTKDYWRGPTLGGLTEILKGAVQTSPDKFVNDLPLFKDVYFNHIYNVLRGLEDAWKEKRSFDWQKVLEFLIGYVDRKEFWADALKHPETSHWDVDHRWVVGQIGRLIQVGTHDDNTALPDASLPTAVRLLAILVPHLSSDENPGETDPATYALNSAAGKVLAAVLEASLRDARVRKGAEPRWNQSLKEAYVASITSRIPEAYTVFGQYLPNFRYLDATWTDALIKSLEADEERFWRNFFIGYLHAPHLYNDLYKLLLPHYTLALTRIHERELSKQVVDHIGVAYLRDIESPDAGLLKALLEENNPARIRGLFSFFWMQRDFATTKGADAEKMRAKILKLVDLAYERLAAKGSLGDADKQVAAMLPRLLVYVDALEQTHVDRLKSHIPFLERTFEVASVIENLNRLKDKGDAAKTAPLVGELFKAIVEQFYPDYDKVHIRSIVAFLLKNHPTHELGVGICNAYAKKDVSFLDDLYKQAKT